MQPSFLSFYHITFTINVQWKGNKKYEEKAGRQKEKNIIEKGSGPNKRLKYIEQQYI